ncbi:ParA family protein [Curtobacterium sp. Csp2]|uniref:ParA family protein n=1 Tax=Curtobacterium sp. Csp2 TaxID=2495430 RepID=UPI003F8D6853
MDISGHLNVADVLENPKEKIVRQAIAPSGWTKGSQGKVDVLVGSPSAINFDGPHPSIRDIWKLEEALANVEQDYELVLIDCAPSLNALTRTAVNQLRESGVSDLAQTTLMSDGASVYLCTSDDEVIDLVSRGQGVFGIAVGKVLREVESSLVELDATPAADPDDELAARRASRAS